jgi:hypothetical protein
LADPGPPASPAAKTICIHFLAACRVFMSVASDSFRLFSCALPECHAQVRLCRKCDRGNWYCSQSCSALARRQSLRRAGAKYQHTPYGREKHKVRQQHYLECKEKMTHQGPANTADDAVSTHEAPEQAAGETAMPAGVVEEFHVVTEFQAVADKPPVQWRCTACGRWCGSLARRGFLGRQRHAGRSPRLACGPPRRGTLAR